ncbi:dihydrolipoamide acetyltransferase family protein [Stakelama pacifica]|uniref:Dihydrolipoamide acetyltransferase component of pyruvate dehydrogenase complex n=1 Tax=Stakelama pacifica TaxID=517720 RepID=A0A4R6FUZ9_9SPHN|nr:dihydrolipoamide acetyltransferase family protein [Stakelama pacifica]TDN85716.1 branched-chain alpha-keto acid dehydrogenase E2 component [Stakelama pacifica]GGO91834.1 lipoamide acyltransferase component of branched-chain alpha-keto acid dehydrogenase complex [Stakelama pacifica]
MARFTFKLPDIGEGISEAEIVAWHVKVGDTVEEDQQLADMMTDKATVEMESPVAGKIVEVAGEEGDQVAIGSMLVVIETDDESAAEAEEEQVAVETPGVEAEGEVEASATTDAQDKEIREKAKANSKPARAEPVEAPSSSSRAQEKEEQGFDKLSPNGGEGRDHDKPVLASPAVRKRARDLNIDLADVASDGDRVRHGDLDAYLRYNGSQGYHAPHAERGWADETVKVIGMRRRIAENMAASKRNIPHFTYVDEIDVTELEAMRASLNANRGSRPKLTVLPFIIVAICGTLRDFPMLNARYDDEAGVVTRSGSVNMGMATQTDAGLMVPVLRDAQDMNVWQLASEIGRLSEAARSGKAKSEEMQGGTITLTSLGPLGGIATTPVINRPEVAIIGPNKIVERPVFQGDDIVRAKLMNLSISCDHRVVDGYDAASYVQALKKLLETPVLLFAD